MRPRWRFRELRNRDWRPGFAAVGGLVDARAAGAEQAGERCVGLHIVVPECSKSDLRIVGREGNIDGAGLVVLVENLAPGLAAVGAS